MQFDLSAVETGTLVFMGTLVFALVITLFMMTASFAALVLVGVGRLAWIIAPTGSITRLGMPDRLVHHASTVELPGDFAGDIAAEIMGQPAPSTGTYPRVVLRDS